MVSSSRQVKQKGKTTTKPPGRYWNKTGSSRICLICLRRYDESELESPVPVVDVEDDDIQIIDLTNDPLSMDAPPKVCNSAGSSLTKGVENKLKSPELYLKFLKIISKYLNIKTKKIRDSTEKHEIHPPFCKDCIHIVQSFCDVYHDFYVSKLKLHWRLSQIANGIEDSNSKVSGKLRVTLHKSLSTQLHMPSANAVQLFRRHIQAKTSGKTKAVTDGMQVSIDKNGYKDYVRSRLKFPIEQMVGYLKSLIVIFALAVAPKEATDELESSSRNGDDDHFEGGVYSPPGSPDKENDEAQTHSDSDWSLKATGSGDDSDVEFSVRPSGSRRWNLRKRRKRTEKEKGEKNDDDDGESFTPGVLPPLRSAKKPKEVVDEADKKFPCNICNLRFITESVLKRHLSQAHAFILAYNCSQCVQRFKTKKDLDAHQKKIHPRPGSEEAANKIRGFGISTKCNYCGKSFPSKIKMFLHRRKAHKADLGKFKCEICEKIVHCRFRLEKHMRAHQRENVKPKPFQCTHNSCTSRFATEESLNAHLLLHEKNPNWIPSRPGQKKISSGDNENQEERKMFKCEVPNCGKFFWREVNLAAHLALHSESSTSFSCSVCDKTFLRIKDIRTHLIQYHESNEKAHFCMHCIQAFTLRQTLELHIKISHPTALKLPCDVDDCFDEFESIEELREHLKSIHLPPDVVEIVEKVETGGIFNFKITSTPAPAENDDTKLAEPKPQLDSILTDSSVGVTDTVQVEDATSSSIDTVPKVASVCTSDDSSVPVDPSTEAPVSTENENNSEALPAQDGVSESQVTPPLASPKQKPEEQLVDPVATISAPEDSTTTINDTVVPTPAESETLHLVKVENNKNETEINQEKESSDTLGLYTCERCKWSFTSRIALSIHMIQHSDRDKKGLYSCNLCIESFRVLSSLQTHYNTKHGPGIKLLSCSQCRQKFHRKESLAVHLKAHKERAEETSESILCTECGEVLTSNRAFSRHMRSHNNNEDDSKKNDKTPRTKKLENSILQCDQCEETFYKKTQLLIHQCNVHGMEKPHPCTADGCTKSFITRESLRNHLKNHQEATLLCPMCPKTFRRKNAYDDHIANHNEEKNHICHMCGKAFNTQKRLTIHMIVHSEDKHKCSYCEKTFTRKFVRDSHERTHTKEKPFKCRVCGEAFGQYVARRNHEKKHERDGVVIRDRRFKIKKEDVAEDVNPTIARKRRKMKGNEEGEIDDDNVPSTSGIIHEALQAAFNDITTDLFTDTAGTETKKEDEEMSTANNSDEDEDSNQDIMNSIDVIRYPSSEHASPAKRRTRQSQRGKRQPSSPDINEGIKSATQSKPTVNDLTCGFCGKVFQRSKPYRAHVDRHLIEAANSGEKERSETTEAHSEISTYQNEAYVPSIPQPCNNPHFASPPSASSDSISESVKKRRGRRSKSSTESPGSRLERIVENVMTTASSSSQHGNTTNASNHNDSRLHNLRNRYQQQAQSPIHQPMQSSPHQHYPAQTPSPHGSMQSPPQLYQSSSPHQNMQSGSDRSTPTMQSQNSLQNQQMVMTSVPGSSFATTTTSSFLNSFLLTNPYLSITRQEGSQLSPMVSGQQQLQQQGQYTHPVSSTNAHYQHLVNQQSSSNNIMPHDLSKSSYPMFFANPR